MHTYMHMYLLEFGLKQTRFKALDPTTAIDCYTGYGYKVQIFISGDLWLHISLHILYTPWNCHYC